MTPFRIAIAGLGTVGQGTLDILTRNAQLIEERCGRPIEVVAVSARTPREGGIRFVQDARELARLPDVDCVVEVIGGSEGVARELVTAALQAGKSVVTANKALIAHHGLELAELAEKNDVTLAFEAAVAGGIPIIKSLRDGLAANRFTRVAGILNGTCNYIVSRMWDEKLGFDTVLADAQKLGYAEADPSFDIDGVDASHKLAILASLAFGTAPAIQEVSVEGIRHVTLCDMEFAHEMGYALRLIGQAEWTESGLSQRVHPCLVKHDSPLSAVHGVFNAVMAEGDAVGRVFFEGRGAGAGPTGSSIVADVMDIARGVRYHPFTMLSSRLSRAKGLAMEQTVNAYYLRLNVPDEPGVLAKVTAELTRQGISVESLLQRASTAGQPATVVLVTHPAPEQGMRQALDALQKSAVLSQPPVLLRVFNG